MPFKNILIDQGGVAGGAVAISEACCRLKMKQKPLVVEGIGGVCVPLWSDYLLSDLVVDIGFPVILVAQDRLGVINDILLSIEHLSRKDVKILGFVLNRSKRLGDLSSQSNAKVIAKFTVIPYLFTIEYGQKQFMPDQEEKLKEVFI